MTGPLRDDTRGAAAPPPPPPPKYAPELSSPAPSGEPRQESESARDSAASRTKLKAKGKARGGKRVVTASTIVALVATCIVVAALIFALWAIGFAQKSPLDTRLGDVSSQNSSSARSSSSDEAAKNDEAKRATADAQQALNALAADEDSRFLDCVQEFVDAYDSVVDERSYSLADLDIDASDLAPRLRSEFECKVVQADVYNGMAWVDIDVTSKNIASAVDSFAREVAGDALSYDDEDAYRVHLKEALLYSIDKQKPRTVRVLLTLEQGDDGWQVSQSDVESLLGSAWGSQ